MRKHREHPAKPTPTKKEYSMYRLNGLIPLMLWCLLLSAGALPAQEESKRFPEPPAILRIEDGTPIRFISVDRAFKPSGELNDELFSPDDHLSFRKILSEPEKDGCIRLQASNSADAHGAFQKDYEDALNHASKVILGKVSRIEPGFVAIRFGSLIGLESQEVLKGSWEREHFFIFFAAANFTLANKKVCYTSHYYGALPEVGDDMIVLIHDYLNPHDSPYVFAGAANIILLKKDQTLQLPWLYQETNEDKARLQPEQFLQWTRDFLAGKTP
jgi:hypothetical protein